MRYYVINGKDFDLFIKKCNEYLAKGRVAQGGIDIVVLEVKTREIFYSQAFILKE